VNDRSFFAELKRCNRHGIPAYFEDLSNSAKSMAWVQSSRGTRTVGIKYAAPSEAG
jgi:hypothetical protein